MLNWKEEKFIEKVTHAGWIQIQIDRTTTGLTRPALWSELSPFLVCQGFRNLSSPVSEYQRLSGTKSCFRETGNNSDKESLLMRGTDLPNENQLYVLVLQSKHHGNHSVAVVEHMCVLSIHHSRLHYLHFVALRAVSKPHSLVHWFYGNIEAFVQSHHSHQSSFCLLQPDVFRGKAFFKKKLFTTCPTTKKLLDKVSNQEMKKVKHLAVTEPDISLRSQ